MQKHNSTNNVVASWRRVNNSYPQKNILSSVLCCLFVSPHASSIFLLFLISPPPSTTPFYIHLRKLRYEVADLDATAVTHKHMIMMQQEAHNYTTAHFIISSRHSRNYKLAFFARLDEYLINSLAVREMREWKRLSARCCSLRGIEREKSEDAYVFRGRGCQKWLCEGERRGELRH